MSLNTIPPARHCISLCLTLQQLRIEPYRQYRTLRNAQLHFNNNFSFYLCLIIDAYTRLAKKMWS